MPSHRLRCISDVLFLPVIGCILEWAGSSWLEAVMRRHGDYPAVLICYLILCTSCLTSFSTCVSRSACPKLLRELAQSPLLTRQASYVATCYVMRGNGISLALGSGGAT